MPKLIEKPTVIDCVGTKPKQIQEFAGRVNSGHAGVSVARMLSPSGWEEPGQRPEFEEITVVLKGVRSRSRPDRRSSRAPASGYATARRDRKGPSTSPCASLPSHPRRFTGTTNRGSSLTPNNQL